MGGPAAAPAEGFRVTESYSVLGFALGGCRIKGLRLRVWGLGFRNPKPLTLPVTEKTYFVRVPYYGLYTALPIVRNRP